MKKIVVVGGGNGTQAPLKGLTKNDNVNLSVVVSMFDSGGSTGTLRKDFNIPAVGDIRRCFVAMSMPDENVNILKDLFGCRFSEGALKGHNLGNLILLGLLQTSKSPAEAWDKAKKLFKVKGGIYPSSMDNSHVVAEFEDGKTVEGETYIDVAAKDNRDPKLRVKKIYSKPPAKGYDGAMKAIMEADLIVIGPGDMYTSVLANFLAVGMSEAIQNTKAKKVYICNVLTKPGETYGMSASEHAAEILKYTGLKKLDYVIVNNKEINLDAIKKHSEVEGNEPQKPVEVDEEKLSSLANKIIYADVVDDENPTKHDPAKLAAAILSL